MFCPIIARNLQRTLWATIALCLTLILYGATAAIRLPWPTLALAGLGERAYAVRLKHLPVGQLVQSAVREQSGNYRFSSQLEFQLAQGQPVRVFETKLFSGIPPFALLSAQHTDTTASTTSSVLVGQIEDPDQRLSGGTSYLARVSRGSTVQEQRLDWQHRLSDYLAVERWLPDAVIDTPTKFTSIDFDSLRLRNDTWTLLARTDEGFEVTKSSQLEATRLFLDPQFKPLRFSLAGTFEIETVDPAELPVKPEPVFHSQTYQVPLSEPIDRHQGLNAMTLRVLGNTALVQSWENTTTERKQTILRSYAATTRMAHPDDNRRYSREELSYPLSAGPVLDLAAIAVDTAATPLEQARQLTEFVHNYIRYDHHSTMQNVLDVIRNQQGDCNEYAELYTTLGRALGMPVRTVIGLAYTDEYAPAFALHAWNEVLLEGSWSAFDPTWNQTRVDATHLPLPDDAGGMLLSITSLNELSFEVLSLTY